MPQVTSACVACKACWQWMPCAHGALSLPSLLSLAALQLLFEKSSCLNFHFKNLGIFMVNIEHYVQFYVDKTQNDDYPLYTKIGCHNRTIYTSTCLQLIF